MPPAHVLLVAAHVFEPYVAREIAGGRTGNPKRSSSETRRSRPRTKSSSLATPRSARRAPCPPRPLRRAASCRSPTADSIAWPKVWPKLSSARTPDSRSSSATISALISHERRMAWASAPRVRGARAARRGPRSTRGSPGRGWRRTSRPRRGPRRTPRGASVSSVADVRDHRDRLVECADHVLAERMVDGSLAAHRRIDLREKRGGHLEVRDSPLVRGGREAGDVADHASAQRDEHRPAVGLCAQQGVEQRSSVRQFLCASPSGSAMARHCAPARSSVAASRLLVERRDGVFVTMAAVRPATCGANSAASSRSP